MDISGHAAVNTGQNINKSGQQATGGVQKGDNNVSNVININYRTGTSQNYYCSMKRGSSMLKGFLHVSRTIIQFQSYDPAGLNVVMPLNQIKAVMPLTLGEKTIRIRMTTGEVNEFSDYVNFNDAFLSQLKGLIDGISNNNNNSSSASRLPQKAIDGINAALNTKKEDDDLISELTQTDIIKCIRSGRVRFRGVNLSGLDLSKLDLSFGDFSSACLKGVSFSCANLQYAKFQGVDAEGSIFNNATLQVCELPRANLRGALLAGANLQNANLQAASLIDCSFCGADLCFARLQDADLTNANLEGASLEGANLQGAKLTKANLKGANLQRAYLQHVNLRDTHLEGAKLDGANLLGAIR